MNRRDCMKSLVGGVIGATATTGLAAEQDAERRSPIIDGAEHAWVLDDPKFPINPELSNCPTSRPGHDQTMERLLADMRKYDVDKVVISHVCYYGTDNSGSSGKRSR